MLKRFFAKVFAFIIVRKIENTYSKSFKIQEKILFSLLKKALSYATKAASVTVSRTGANSPWHNEL